MKKGLSSGKLKGSKKELKLLDGVKSIVKGKPVK